MVDVIRALVLGIIQGLTEFLPVSSSGHLELAKYILGDDAVAGDSLLMTVVLHFGTALSTVAVFRKEISQILVDFVKGRAEELAFATKIVISMVPATIVGLWFEKEIEAFFTQNILLVCSMLLITAILLIMADRSKTTDKDVSIKDAVIIGIAQAIAILPGISRSGATVSTSVFLGIDRGKAARFSFLMVVPLIFGKIAKDLLDGDFIANGANSSELVAGFIGAFISGFFACTWMISLVKKSNLRFFAYYCILVGVAGIAYVLFKG